MRILYNRSGRMIVECEPALRTIFTPAYYDGKRFQLSIPYQVWDILNIRNICNNTYLYFRRNPVTENDNVVYYPLLTNIDDFCRVCLGRSQLPMNVEAMISYFWQSEFTWSLTDCIQRYKMNLDRYAEETRKNPEYWKVMRLLECKTLRI